MGYLDCNRKKYSLSMYLCVLKEGRGDGNKDCDFYCDNHIPEL